MTQRDSDRSWNESEHTRVLVSGASGFLGTHLCHELVRHGFETHGMIRRVDTALPPQVVPALVTDLRDSRALERAAADMSTVVHLAGRAHVMRDSAVNPIDELRRVNVAGTLNLGRHAAEAGVRRFVFISSIKVNGDQTSPGRPYTADDLPAPADAYGLSKYEAEEGLRQLARETGLELVIIRPVLVYGPGVSANFLSMMRWISKGIPLPLGAVHNCRSFVAWANLIDLITTCLNHPAAVNETFLVSDGEDVSTTTLLRRMGAALGRPARLLPVPAPVVSIGASLLGKKALARRLCGSLQVDISKTRQLLGWAPRLCMEEALKTTAEHFLN